MRFASARVMESLSNTKRRLYFASIPVPSRCNTTCRLTTSASCAFVALAGSSEKSSAIGCAFSPLPGSSLGGGGGASSPSGGWGGLLGGSGEGDVFAGFGGKKRSHRLETVTQPYTDS